MAGRPPPAARRRASSPVRAPASAAPGSPGAPRSSSRSPSPRRARAPRSHSKSEAFASAAKGVQINIAIVDKTFNYQISNYNDANPADKRYENDWGAANWGEFGTTAYPTENEIFNTGGVQNFGDYFDAKADRLIHQAIYGNQASSATTVATYLAKDVPMLFLACADVIDAVSKRVGGTNDSFLAMTQDVVYPQYWYVKKS